MTRHPAPENPAAPTPSAPAPEGTQREDDRVILPWSIATVAGWTALAFGTVLTVAIIVMAVTQ